MPFILAPIAAAIGVSVTTLVVGAAVVVGLALAFSKLGGVPNYSAGAGGAAYTHNPTYLTFATDAPRRIVYGKARVSGVVAYANVAGAGYEYLYMVIVVSANQIQSIDQIYFDGVDGPTAATGFYEYWYHDGTQTTADAPLMAVFPEWNVNCKLLGCAYAVVKLKYDSTVWKNGRPNIQFDVKGKPVYDPRNGLTAWTNNAALITADFMTSADGLGATSAEMDWDSVEAAADIAAQMPDGMTASLCDGRYTIDGVVELSSKNGDILSQMLAACAGTVVWTEGKYRMYMGAAVTPVSRSITGEDLRDNISLQPYTPSDQSFNSVKGRFLDATNGWVFNDFPPVSGAAYVLEDGGVIVYKDIALNLTTSPLTAQRLATIFLRRARLDKTINLSCKWTCFNYEVWDVVKINLPELGWVDKLFQITEWKMSPPTTDNAGGIDLTLIEYSADIYSDDMDLKPIDGGGTIVIPDITIPNPLPVLYATSNAGTVDPVTNKPRIRFDWPQSTDIYTVGYEIAFGKYPFTPVDSNFIYVPGRSSITYTTGALNPGDTYIGYIRAKNSYDKRSTNTASNIVIVAGSVTNTPEDLTGLTYAVVDSMFGDLTWTPASQPVASTLITWAPTNDYGISVIVAEVTAPTSTIRLARNVADGYYFAAFKSSAGLIGLPASVAAAGRPPATILQTLSLSQYDGDLTNGIWVTPYKAVSKSTKLASELGWEVFDMMVPQPYGQIEYWKKDAYYVASGTLRTSGSLGWARAPSVPGVLPVVNATAKVMYYSTTEYKQGQFTLTADANNKIGFKVSTTEPQGVQFIAFDGTLEKL